MSLRVAVAAPFRRHGDSEMGKNSFVVDLSLKRDWLTPDQATRLVDIAASAGLLEVEGDTLQATFDTQSVDIPDGFRPTEELLEQPTPFEQILTDITATGIAKQTAVAEINQLQTSLGVTVETAGIVFARQNGVAVDGHIERILGDL